MPNRTPDLTRALRMLTNAHDSATMYEAASALDLATDTLDDPARRRDVEDAHDLAIDGARFAASEGHDYLDQQARGAWYVAQGFRARWNTDTRRLDWHDTTGADRPAPVYPREVNA